MTEEQFSALCDLIARLSVLNAGILIGSSRRDELVEETKSKARAILVEPKP